MMKAVLWGLACTALVMAGPAGAQSDYGFVIHMQQTTDLVQCDAPGSPDDNTLTCGDVAEVGDLASQQKAWVIAYGWENAPEWPAGRGLGGAEFALTWDPGVTVLLWTLCTGGNSIPDPSFPTLPGSGLAVTWAGGNYVQPNGWARVGFLVVAPGSSGRMTIAPHQLLNPPAALLSSAGGPGTSPVEALVPPAAYSSADVGGTNPDDGRKACSEPVPIEERTWGEIKSVYEG